MIKIINGVKYDVGEKTVSVCGFAEDVPKNIEILAEVDGKPVVIIAENAFYECEKLENVKIPDGATSIGNWAFYDCESLANIAIPDSVTSIGEGAFSNCTSLTSIIIPNSVTSIDGFTFRELPQAIKACGFC